jgi:hypothetical protein
MMICATLSMPANSMAVSIIFLRPRGQLCRLCYGALGFLTRLACTIRQNFDSNIHSIFFLSQGLSVVRMAATLWSDCVTHRAACCMPWLKQAQNDTTFLRCNSTRNPQGFALKWVRYQRDVTGRRSPKPVIWLRKSVFNDDPRYDRRDVIRNSTLAPTDVPAYGCVTEGTWCYSAGQFSTKPPTVLSGYDGRV